VLTLSGGGGGNPEPGPSGSGTSSPPATRTSPPATATLASDTFLEPLTPSSGDPPLKGLAGFGGLSFPDSVRYDLEDTDSSGVADTTWTLNGQYTEFDARLGVQD